MGAAYVVRSVLQASDFPLLQKCKSYLLLPGEVALGNGVRASLYFFGLAYCFFGLSAITRKFFHSMENIVKHERKVVEIDPHTNTQTVRYEKVWNYTIADITLLALGTSFAQISLAVIDAIQNIGSLYAGGLGPGILVGSAAFDLFPIHAVCVVVPKAGELKKISDLGVWLVELFWSFWAYFWLYIILEVWTPGMVTLWESLLTVLQFGLFLVHAYAQAKRWPYLSLPIERTERPEEWVPEESDSCSYTINNDYIFSVHTSNEAGLGYQCLPSRSDEAESSPEPFLGKYFVEERHVFTLWKQQFVDALVLESAESRKVGNTYLRLMKLTWHLFLVPWRLLFAFVPPSNIAHGWFALVCSLLFITGIAYVVTQLTDLISCITGMNAFVIAFTALASGTSWPDLVASKIAVERQMTADSAIANIICSNSVNIYVGIGIPWLIHTAYNHIAYREPLIVKNAGGLGLSLLVFLCTSAGCISVLVFRRFTLGAELGGPRLWAWVTFAYLMLLWLIFVVLSSLAISGVL